MAKHVTGNTAAHSVSQVMLVKHNFFSNESQTRCQSKLTQKLPKEQGEASNDIDGFDRNKGAEGDGA